MLKLSIKLIDFTIKPCIVVSRVLCLTCGKTLVQGVLEIKVTYRKTFLSSPWVKKF
jgi:hypothetical protein